MFHSRETLKVNDKNHLEIGGADCVDLVKKFGTPLYVYDEKQIRDMCSIYRNTIEKEYDGNGTVCYASKAFSCLAIYKIVQSENLGVDVVSGGELYTAIKAGFDTSKIYMHGNNKLEKELILALDNKVGTIVADGYGEIDMIDKLAAERGIKQNILLRINPGIVAHTVIKAAQTAKPDSKFGFPIADGYAEAITKYTLSKEHIILNGFHCHIGSQIFDKESYKLAVDKMTSYVKDIKDKYGFEANELSFGGGFGIWYTNEQPIVSVEGYSEYVKAVTDELKIKCAELGLKRPRICFEPGRSIVGEAGITLYTVGAIKEISGIKKYVAVDGGMGDNPRYALYKSKYTALLANRVNDKPTEIVTIAGKCCESGDIVCSDVTLPKANVGDIVAILSTGAYCYSMASNYNRNPVPPAILVKDGKAQYIIKPQTYEDMIRNDVIPDYLE